MFCKVLKFIQKETLAQVFSCEFCEVFKNTFFYRTPLVAASENYTFMIISPSSFGSVLTVRKRPPSSDIEAPGSGISWFPFISWSKDNPRISRRRSTTAGFWHDLTLTLKVNCFAIKTIRAFKCCAI